MSITGNVTSNRGNTWFWKENKNGEAVNEILKETACYWGVE